MVLRLAGLLVGVSSSTERATSSLPWTVLLDCAERGPVERNARCLEGCDCSGWAVQAEGRESCGRACLAATSERARGEGRSVDETERVAGTGATGGSEWRASGRRVRAVLLRGRGATVRDGLGARQRQRAARPLRMSEVQRWSDGAMVGGAEYDAMLQGLEHGRACQE